MLAARLRHACTRVHAHQTRAGGTRMHAWTCYARVLARARQAGPTWMPNSAARAVALSNTHFMCSSTSAADTTGQVQWLIVRKAIDSQRTERWTPAVTCSSTSANQGNQTGRALWGCRPARSPRLQHRMQNLTHARAVQFPGLQLHLCTWVEGVVWSLLGPQNDFGVLNTVGGGPAEKWNGMNWG